MKFFVRALALFLVAGWFSLQAQPTSAADDRRGPERRVLNGHRFLPSGALTDPFVTTHVRSKTLAGLAGDFRSPTIDIAGDTLGVLEGDIAFFGLSFEYQQNLFGWGALRLDVSGSGRAGIDEQALLADGVNTIYGVVFEGKGRLLYTGASQLTAIARVSRKNIFGISPFDFAESIIDSGISKSNDLVKEGNVHRFIGGLAGAHAWNEYLGTQLQVAVGWAQPFDDELPNETVFQAGVVVDLDLVPLTGTPMGFVVSYDYDSFPEGGSDVAQGISSVAFGIAYTGRDDFSLGLEISRASIKQVDLEERFTATQASLNLRYYF